MTRKQTNILILLLAAVGGLISLYLWTITIKGGGSVCLTSCDQVLTSEYGKMLGVPVATFGAFYYGFMAMLALQRTKIKAVLLDQMVWLGAFVGFMQTVYLRYVEFFKLDGKICMWCWGSVVVVVLISVLSFYEYRRRNSPEFTEA